LPPCFEDCESENIALNFPSVIDFRREMHLGVNYVPSDALGGELRRNDIIWQTVGASARVVRNPRYAPLRKFLLSRPIGGGVGNLFGQGCHKTYIFLIVFP